ncbi:uncharacterized protein LOC117146842 [Drosophila mauritiana]|uniref:Uncharacterized protein LOC117146842 n=1 Tax=Drosophila mauritiana TaxID=7226 RepID=A0A6P8KZT8_DROMA|nr:uncharacterized protein LOC117146842 [Drosophila mauritiana]
MKHKMETNLPASIWMNKSSPEPSFATSNGVKNKTVSFSRFIHTDRVADGPTNAVQKKTVFFSRFERTNRAAENLTRPLASMKPKQAVASTSNEPFFASNLKYYPHLPQPAFVGNYQTYAEIKGLWLDGHFSQACNTTPSPAQPRRRNSITNEFPDDPPKRAPNRRYSLVRRNSINPPIANFAMPVLMEENEVQDLNETSGSTKPATSTSKGAIPEQPKKFPLTF